MKFSQYLIIAFVVLVLFSCKGTTAKIGEVKMVEVKTETEVPLPSVPTSLKVSAYLIFRDSTISTFDVLNDKSIVLWNTIIGGADALKPSKKTKIDLTGKSDSLKVTIYNGKLIVVNQKLLNSNRDNEFIIDNTGCEELKVIVTELGKIVYENKIPYKCGE